MFINALPLWPKGKEWEKNSYAVFCAEADITAGDSLHITAATFYRVYIDGTFLGFGPARAAAGYAREDIYSLAPFKGHRQIRIEVAGYACRSLSTVYQPSFLLCELQREGKSILDTASFTAYAPRTKVQKSERYSVQRHFAELWDLRETDGAPVETAPVPCPTLLERVAPYPLYEDKALTLAVSRGTLTYDETLPYRDRYSWAEIPERWGRYEIGEVPFRPYIWLQRHVQQITQRSCPLPLTLKAGEYAIFDFGQIEAGFIKLDFDALTECEVAVGYAEYYEGEHFTYGAVNAHNGIGLTLPAGERQSMSFEPYTFRFVIVALKEGSLTLRSLGVKTFEFDHRSIPLPDYEDKTLSAIYRAAVRSFAHNAVDLYSDCPSRERAGWLCDSFFTAKTEYALTGKTAVEDAFLENYRLFENKDVYPEGALPMCYPSDDMEDQRFIPQWTMWYILEVADYVLRRGHADQKERFRKSIYDLLDFYKRYENRDGLLERLPSWNFVEWSRANDWTWDVNYPTNFLYAGVLEAVDELYGDEECRRKCARIRRVAVEQSFNGHHFLDHAEYDENGVLQRRDDSSQACQYYAILFAGIDIREEKYAALLHLILHVFDPDKQNAVPEIMDVNAFIGAYLRLEALMKIGEYALALQDIKKFFGKMEQHTGTLWEYRELKGSHDHGFASYALVVIERALGALK